MQIINDLLNYALEKNLIQDRDRIYVQNSICALLKIQDPTELNNIKRAEDLTNIDALLKPFLQFAFDQGIIESMHPDFADLFDTALMGLLCPFPSTVQDTFDRLNSKEATQYLYHLNIDSNYVRMNRIKKNIQWQSPSPVGDLDISINLSKPEKDPKAIALQSQQKPSSYPKCLLCHENEGFAGTMVHPARQNLRTIRLELGCESWYMQYSPYIYYPEHSIIFSSEHRPMKISAHGFANLLEFIERFPHYFIGSNSDIPIVGGSILSHDHYQAGSYEFPINRAKIVKQWKHGEVQICQLDWSLNTIRFYSQNKEQIIDLADKLLNYWINYEAPSLDIIKSSNGERHNAITPIARQSNGAYELDLVLRNNRTNEEHPMGIFHPHTDKHHIKKENIGLIEVMGLAILPERLIQEMESVKKSLLAKNLNLLDSASLKHKVWCENLLQKHNFTNENIEQIIQDEIALVFYAVLEDCKVIKCKEKLSGFIEEFLSKQ